jgi:hypothetical protein
VTPRTDASDRRSYRQLSHNSRTFSYPHYPAEYAFEADPGSPSALERRRRRRAEDTTG